MQVLELFAGVGSFGNPARALGWKVFSLDFNETLPNIDACCDIMEWDYKAVDFVPDVIWASPECKAWSIAAAAKHSQLCECGVKLNSTYAQRAREQLNRTLEIISYFLSINPLLKWYIENPASSRIWHLPEMQTSKKIAYNKANLIIPRLATIEQCQYGREDKKPTTIATNDLKWQTSRRCPGRNNGCHHKANAQSSNAFSTQSYKKRACFPETIAREILTQLCPVVITNF